jgi:xylulokinase
VTVLGIDLGTSGVKVVLTDRSGGVLADSGREYTVDRPHPGWAESDPAAWWSAIRDAVTDVLGQRPAATPVGIGLSGQMHGVVLIDAGGAPVGRAILWEDARAESQVDRLRSLDPDILARLANPLSPGMAGPILGWLAEHAPDRVARSSLALQPKDWVRGRLTGRWAGEPSDASATLLYDLPADRWDLEVADALGVPARLLPPLLPQSGARAGELLPGPAAELGLPPGIPVAAGAGDTPAGALGAGLTEPGTIQLTIGTGVQLVTPVTERPAPVANPVTHLYRAATRDGWYAMAAGLTGGATLSWVRQLFAVDWPDVYATAARPPNPDDPIFLPYLIGERTPYLDPRMRGAWTGLDARHDRAALLYAALEGVAFAIADGLDALPGRTTRRVLRLAGGGSTHPAWRALLANALRAELHAVDTPAASARGAALLGAVAAGLLDEGDLSTAAVAHTTLVAEPGAGAAALEPRRARFHRVLAALRDQRAIGFESR